MHKRERMCGCKNDPIIVKQMLLKVSISQFFFGDCRKMEKESLTVHVQINGVIVSGVENPHELLPLNSLIHPKRIIKRSRSDKDFESNLK